MNDNASTSAPGSLLPPLSGGDPQDSSHLQSTSSSASSPSIAIAPIPVVAPIKPYIVAGSVSSAVHTAFPEDKHLDLSRNNWHDWSKRIINALAMCSGNLTSWLDGTTLCPNQSLWPTEYCIWVGNDRMVRAYCSARASGEDRVIIDKASTALVMWSLLKHRHSKQGPYAQALRLRDLLGFKFDVSKPLPGQARQILEECEHIVNMGVFTAESLAIVAVLHILAGGDLKHIANQLINAQSDTTNPLTMSRIIRIMELEQQQMNANDSVPAVGSLALAAQVDSRPLCINCKRRGHITDKCFQPGGKCFDQRDAILAEIRARKSGKGKGPPPGKFSGGRQQLHKTADGTAYFIHNGFAIFPDDAAVSPAATVAGEFAGLALSGDLHMGGSGLSTDAIINGADVPPWILELTSGTEDSASTLR